MDWFAIASYGAYPTPTPTNPQRSAFAVSYGFLDTLYNGTISTVKATNWLRTGPWNGIDAWCLLGMWANIGAWV